MAGNSHSSLSRRADCSVQTFSTGMKDQVIPARGRGIGKGNESNHCAQEWEAARIPQCGYSEKE
jgi:hypothetical protein